MDLPDQFDVVVLGTGLTESIISAAASRAGKTVLHLDSKNYYGSEWTSLNFKQVEKWIKSESDDSKSLFSNIECLELYSEEWTQSKLERLGNKINIDLCPRFIYSSGPMVELLIKSNISRYLEFINCHRLYFLKEEGDGMRRVSVPSSRSDIFTSKDLSIIQKRRLTKFLETHSNSERYSNTETHSDSERYFNSDLSEVSEISLKKLMDNQQLDPELQIIIRTVLAMKSDDCSASEAVSSLRRFIASVGRYGDTPFLWTMAGCGELPQAFCRLSAVFGATYCLEASPTELHSENDGFKFNFKGSEKKSSFIVGSISNIPSISHSITPSISHSSLKKSSHVACLTTKSLTETDDDRTSLLRMEGGSEGITVIELGYSSSCVPKGLYLVHLTCPSVESAKEDLMPVVEKLFSTSPDSSGKPPLIWSLFYNISFLGGSINDTVLDTVLDTVRDTVRDNVLSDSSTVFLVDGPVLEMDYGKCIKEARSVFEKMFPGEEFLPKAPDAEDIVIEDIVTEGDNVVE